VIEIGTKSKGITSLLANLSRTLDYFVGGLLIVLGLYLYFLGFENVKTLVALFSSILIIYGIKKILDGFIGIQMDKELEELVRERK